MSGIFGASPATGKELIHHETLTSSGMVEVPLSSDYKAFEFLVISQGGAAFVLSNDGSATYETSSAYEINMGKLSSGTGTAYSGASSTAYNAVFMANGAVTNKACVGHGFLTNHADASTKTLYVGTGGQLSTADDFDGGTNIATRNVAETNDYVRFGESHTANLNAGDTVIVWGMK